MRLATVKDLPALVGMAKAFHDATSPEWPWSEQGVSDTFAAVIDTGFVSISSGGFIAGAIHPHPLSPSWVQAHELLWWATDRSGPRHANAFRQWAIDQGANEIKWSCRADNDRVQAFYRKFSQPVEAVYSELV